MKFVYNCDHNNLYNELLKIFKQYKILELWIAVAFIKMSGISEIEHIIRSLSQKGAIVKIFTGIDFGITEPIAIRHLVQIGRSAKYPDRFKVYLIKQFEGSYHPKVYRFLSEENEFIAIGSSNLTKGGLKTNSEANVIVTEKKGTAFCRDVENMFHELEGSAYLTSDNDTLLDMYEKNISKMAEYRQQYDKAANSFNKSLNMLFSQQRKDIGYRKVRKGIGKRAMAKDISKSEMMKRKQKYLEYGTPDTISLFNKADTIIRGLDNDISLSFGDKATVAVYSHQKGFAGIKLRKKSLRCEVFTRGEPMNKVTPFNKYERWGWFRIDSEDDFIKAEIIWMESLKRHKIAVKNGEATSIHSTKSIITELMPS